MDSDTQNQASARPTAKFTPPSDPSKYIRTYAKDVAMLTNTPAPTASAAASMSATPNKEDRDASGVALPDFDPSPVQHTGESVSPKEFKQEKVVLSESDSDDIFTAKRSAEEDREAILARLRSKVSAGGQTGSVSLAPSSASAPIPNVAPIGAIRDTYREAITPQEPTSAAFVPPDVSPVIPAPEPIEIPAPTPETRVEEPALRTGAPTFAPIPESRFSMPPVQGPAPAVPQPAPVATPEGPAALHTFSTDFADRIDTQQSSTFSVLAAQSDAGQTPKSTRPPSSRRLLPLAAGFAMVVIGIGAIVGAYVYTHSNEEVPVVAGVPSIITFDESVEVKGTGSTLAQALSDVSQGTSVSGNVVVTYVTTPDTATGIAGVPQPGGVLIRALSLSAPDILLRNIDDASTVGFIRAGNESRPFFVLRVDSYERTFAGMLAWEATMAASLQTLYPAYPSAPVAASSTASTTPSVALSNPLNFSDAVVNNYDVRILRDSSGRSLVLYGYRGKDTLIIARDEAAFTALVSRLSSSAH